jgi:hypothetical protein
MPADTEPEYAQTRSRTVCGAILRATRRQAGTPDAASHPIGSTTERG